MAPKKIFFVAYGGGHIKIVDLVASVLKNDREVELRILALTSGYQMVRGKYPAQVIRRMSDYLPLFDDDIEQILSFGIEILPENYTPALGITKFESIAYLGLSFFDLVTRFGEAEARAQYEARKRHAFLPLTILRKILELETPDLVVATTAPKCEISAIRMANELGIETAQIVDLFADFYPPPEAQNIIVLNEEVANDFRRKGYTDVNILPLGQPVFDETVRRVKAVDRRSTKEKLGVPADARVLLLASNAPVIVNEQLQILSVENYHSAFGPLADVLEGLVSELDVWVALRIHPNERAADYAAVFDGVPQLVYANDTLNLHESLAIADFVLTPSSTVAVEAVCCGIPTFTYQRDTQDIYPFPRAMLPPFIFSRGHTELTQKLRNALTGKSLPDELSTFHTPGAAERIAAFLTGRARPKQRVVNA